ncbi:hypothetical protein [Variovorax sp. J31P207]|nr:hypothetical protein [Variovorax sp. J31P207]MDM0071485.1 hypothetical protein [Variovorax sp. J31P207]
MEMNASTSTLPPRGSRGIQGAQIWEAADALLVHQGLRPTTERVREKTNG